MPGARRSMGTVQGQKPVRMSASQGTGSTSAQKRGHLAPPAPPTSSSRLPRPASATKASSARGTAQKRSGSSSGLQQRGSTSSNLFVTPRSQSATRTPQAQRLLNNITNNVRQSSVGVPGARGSHIGARGSFVGAKAVKDDRPLADKAWQRETVLEIISFLDDNNFPKQLATNNFPLNSAEFKNVFTFLMSYLQPNFALNGPKIEQEIPALLKTIRYPVTVSKSCFQTLGTNHSWPAVLGVLHFLMQSARIMIEVMGNAHDIMFPNQDENGFPISDGPSDEKLVYCNLVVCYNAFNRGKDDFQDELDDLHRSLLDARNFSDEALNRCKRERDMLKTQITNLKNTTGHAEALAHKFENQRNDLEELEKYRVKTRSYIDVLDGELTARRGEFESCEERLVHLRGENAETRRRCEEKGLDVENSTMDEALWQMKSAVEETRSKLQKEDNKIWSLQKDLAKLTPRADAFITQFNDALRDLGVKEDEEGGLGQQLYLDLHRPLGEVAAALMQLARDLRDEEVRLDQQLEDTKKDLRRLTDSKEALAKEAKTLKTELYMLEEEIAQKESQQKEVDKAVTRELERVKADLLASRERGHQDLRALNIKEGDLRKKLEASERELERTKNEGMDKLEANFVKAKAFVKSKEEMRDRIQKKYLSQKRASLKEDLEAEMALQMHFEKLSEEWKQEDKEYEELVKKMNKARKNK